MMALEICIHNCLVPRLDELHQTLCESNSQAEVHGFQERKIQWRIQLESIFCMWTLIDMKQISTFYMIDYAFWWYWFCRHFRVCSRDCSRLRMTYNVAMSACERWRDVFLLWEGMRWGDKVASCICVVGDSLENNRLMRFQEVPWTITAFWCINICIYVSLHWHTTIFTATCI